MRDRRMVLVAVLLLVVGISKLTRAEKAAFNGVKVADAKGKQTDAQLIFSDSNETSRREGCIS